MWKVQLFRLNYDHRERDTTAAVVDSGWLTMGERVVEFITEAGCGLTVKPEDPQAVAQGICNLLALGEDARKAMGQRGQAYVMANHTYPVLGHRFLEIISCCKFSSDGDKLIHYFVW